MYPNFRNFSVKKKICILELFKFPICDMSSLSLWYFFSLKFSSANILFWKITKLQTSWTNTLMTAYALDIESFDYIFIWPHMHHTFFLAQPFNIVAAITSRVFGWTEICYFSWCLSWRNFLPFPNYKEILYVLVQYFKFYQALKLLGVHFCVMSRDHVFHGITLLNSF